MASQFSLLGKSITELKKNPVLFIPMLLYFGASIPLGLVSYLLFLPSMVIYLTTQNLFATITAGAISLIIYFLIIIAFSSAFIAPQGGMICDVIIKQKTAIGRLWHHIKTYFKPVFKTYLALFVVSFLFILFLSAIVILASAVSPVLGIIFLVLSSILYLLFFMALLFIFPIVFARNVSGFKAISEAIKYTKNNFSHALSTFLVILLLCIIFYAIIFAVFLIFFGSSFQQGSEALALASSMLFYVIINLVFSIGAAVFGIILFIYIFNSYFDKNPIKNWK